jgi:acetolactate synthase-1/2/3 large subunit
MKSSDLLVKSLENEGVPCVFGIPGEEILDVMDSISRSNIRFYLTRHEQGAAFMAGAYGRLTGKAGVCLSTLGPGAMNLATGVADAFLDYSPLLAITGQVSRARLYKESHQHIDIVEAYKPITKWNAQVEIPESIPEIVRKAFKIAQTEKPGPTHIEIPEDVAGMEVSGVAIRTEMPQYALPGTSNVEKAARIIEKAEYPIIIAGNGVLRRGASRQLRELARTLQIPVAQTFMGLGAIEAANPLSLMTVGLQAHDWIMCGLDMADVVITVGYDLVEYPPEAWNPDKRKHIVHIDTLSSEVDQFYNPEIEILGEIGDSLARLSETTKANKNTPVHSGLREMIISELEQYSNDDDFPVKPQKVLSDLRRVLKGNDILISDVGAHKIWIARMYPANEPNTVLISNGFAAMGIAIPSAIAAKLVYPKRKVVVVCGDGGFLMSSQELETAIRLGIAFVTVVWADSNLGLIEWKQMNKFGHSFGVSFNNPDIVKYAESMGLAGFRISSSGELFPTLQKALDLKVPSIIEVPIDYRENLKLTKKLGDIVCPV